MIALENHQQQLSSSDEKIYIDYIYYMAGSL